MKTTMITVLFISFLTHGEYLKVYAESCTYNAEIVHACADANRTGKRFNIYHTNTPDLTHDTTCSCSITGLPNEIIRVAVTNTPGFNNCGSSIDIFKPDKTGYGVTCTDAATEYRIALTDGTTIIVIFKTIAHAFSSTEFCIFVEDTSSSNMRITCSASDPPFPMTGSHIVTPGTQNTERSVNSPVTQYTPTDAKSSSTYAEPFTYSTTTLMPDTSYDKATQGFVTDIVCTSERHTIILEVVLPVGFGGFTFGVLLTVGVMCFIFRRQKIEIGEHQQSKTETPVTANVYDQLAVGNNAENACYEHIQNTEITTYENAF